MYVCVYVCIHVYIHICMYEYMCVCIYVPVCKHAFEEIIHETDVHSDTQPHQRKPRHRPKYPEPPPTQRYTHTNLDTPRHTHTFGTKPGDVTETTWVSHGNVRAKYLKNPWVSIVMLILFCVTHPVSSCCV